MPAGIGGSSRINTRGFAELRRALRRMDTELDREVRNEVAQVGALIRTEAQHRAPEGSAATDPHPGQLRGSLKVSVRQRVASIYTRVPYAAVHEFGGTIRPKGTPITIPGSHYLLGARDDLAEVAERRLMAALDVIVARAGFH